MSATITEVSATNATVVRSVNRPKVYSSMKRAMFYGCVRDAALITMLDGSNKWVALPFWHHTGAVIIYNEH